MILQDIAKNNGLVGNGKKLGNYIPVDTKSL